MMGRLFVFAVIALLPVPAFAVVVPTTFTVDTEQTSLAVALYGYSVVNQEYNLIGNTTTGVASGSLQANIEQSGVHPPALHFSDIDGIVVLNNFSVATEALGTFNGIGFQLKLNGAGPYAANGSNPSTVDLSGLPAGAVAGIVNLQGLPLRNFGSNPKHFTLSSPTLAAFEETGGPPNYALDLSIPVDGEFEVNFANGMLVTIQGSLIFQGIKTVPEPGTWCLGAGALMGLVAAARRRARQRRTRLESRVI